MRYIRFYQPYRQWTTREAIARARAAAATSCAVAIGIKPLDQTELATMVGADSR